MAGTHADSRMLAARAQGDRLLFATAAPKPRSHRWHNLCFRFRLPKALNKATPVFCWYSERELSPHNLAWGLEYALNGHLYSYTQATRCPQGGSHEDCPFPEWQE